MSTYNRTGYTYFSLLVNGIKVSIKGSALGKLGTRKIDFSFFLLRADQEIQISRSLSFGVTRNRILFSKFATAVNLPLSTL